MSRYIPPELYSNILARLPIADVIRCTSVCKSWYDLITSPSFISSHLNLSISNAQSRVMTKMNYGHELEHYYLHRDSQTFDEIKELERPLRDNPRILIHGTSNGVFCCSGNYDETIYRERLMLWNPSLDKHLILPQSRGPRAGEFARYGQQRHVGFGFLPSTNDFKIVRVIYRVPNSNGKHIVPPDVEVYESSTRSWHDVDATGFSYVLKRGCGQALLKGKVHWTAHNWHGVGGIFLGLIGSFDLATEKFSTFMLPEFAQNVTPGHFGVCTLKESLCLLLTTRGKGSIYIMKEYGNQYSWREMFTYDSVLFLPLYIRENGDILGGQMCSGRGGWKLVSCNPKTEQVVDLGIGPVNLFFLDAYSYVDNLFLLK